MAAIKLSGLRGLSFIPILNCGRRECVITLFGTIYIRVNDVIDQFKVTGVENDFSQDLLNKLGRLPNTVLGRNVLLKKLRIWPQLCDYSKVCWYFRKHIFGACPTALIQQSSQTIDKSPKLHFLDSGLLAAIRDVSPEVVHRDKTSFGPNVTTFVFSELQKFVTWSDQQYTFPHFSYKAKHEVDIVFDLQFIRHAPTKVFLYLQLPLSVFLPYGQCSTDVASPSDDIHGSSTHEVRLCSPSKYP